ncbi:unnamed protein product [Rotaria socialis]|uniref:Uncharacterized protein n=1 Tax=Rotaria socialis TaxID=392032 RepID=A0A818FKG9_9BILA|nr:unnamed protein product [Rotaria socialis]CAF4623049.1 unnamed protein product [Rotaria socialis]
MKKKFVIYFLVIIFVYISSVQATLTVPVGLLFNGHDRDVYSRISSLARKYVLNKVERRFQYDVIESIDTVDLDNSDIDIWSSLCNQLSNGIMSIIGHIDHSDFDWLSSFCSAYQVPFIGLDIHDYTKTNYYVSLMPDILPALVAFVRRYEITRLVYIYDDINGARRLKQLMELQTKHKIHSINIISRYLGNPDDSYDLLQNIEMMTNEQMHSLSSATTAHKVQGRYIVLDFHSFDTYQIVMDKIKHRGMTTADYHYILLSLNAKQLDMNYFRYGGVNVTFFAIPSYENNNNDNQTIMLYETYMDSMKNANIPNAPYIESLLIADAWETLLRTINRMLNSPNETRDKLKVFRQGKFYNGVTPGIDCRSNSIEPWSPGKVYLETLLNTSFQGLTGNVQFSSRTGQRTNYTLDVYRVTRNDMPKHIGFFRPPTTLEVVDDSSYRFRTSFDNRTRLVVTIFDEPFMMLKKNQSDTATESSIRPGTILDPSMVEGFCADLAFSICHEKLKLPYKFLIETKYGNEQGNGNWDGMVGALANRDADLSIASLTINGAREKVVDFSKPFIDLGISIMIGKPEKQKPGVFSFMAPLSKEIWICVIISYLLVSAILFFVSRSSSYEWYFENESDVVPRNKFSMQNALFFSFAAFMHQGVDLLPRSFSGRVVTSAWWFFSLILVSSYTANLAAFLTVEKLVTPIETVEDLAKQTEIRYGTVRGGATMAFFNKSTLTTFKRMWNFMQQHKDDVFVTSNRDGIQKVRNSKGKFALLLESTLNEYVNERHPCDTMRIGENIDAKGYGIATPLGSDLREAINIAVLELTENGFLESLKRKWYYERSECTNVGKKDSKQSTPLNLANVAGMFYVLIVGLGMAMVIAFLEFLIKAKIDSTRLNQNIRDVMRRNLRISITGIDFDEKEQNIDYWPLQQQQQQQQQEQEQQQAISPFNSRLDERNERTPTITSVVDLPKTADSFDFNEHKDSGFHFLHRDHTSHV